MDRAFRAIYNSSIYLKDIKNMKDLEKCPQKYRIKITNLLYNFDILHNFYIKFRKEHEKPGSNFYIPTIKSSQIYLNDYFQSLLLFNEILFNNFSFKNHKIQKTLQKFKFEKSFKFVRLNTNTVESIEINRLIKKYNLKSTSIPNVFKTTKQIFIEDINRVINQEFPSCLPAYLLNPSPNSRVIDACGAPGNKTNHLSSIMMNTGEILVYEADKIRFEMMEKRLFKMNSKNIKCFNKDFLSVDSFTDVDYILVDPSCSGSGIRRSSFNNSSLNKNFSALIKCSENVKKGILEIVKEQTDKFDINLREIENKNKEIMSFSQNQTMLLKKAMSLNPKKIVYSTCSIYEMENEEVIKNCLTEFPNFKFEKIEFDWNTRGLGKYQFGESCLRFYPDKLYSGFFIAVLINKNIFT
ncbi:putative 28S rRNA (cytosine-C(5))-methyltransferase [Cucumispora dikerogammari]|nr:putative 28S rRNA (cytosine-C(5))-methyltransferase [Cucumispora dikerogammari]